jgi:hypothetical protein
MQTCADGHYVTNGGVLEEKKALQSLEVLRAGCDVCGARDVEWGEK